MWSPRKSQRARKRLSAPKEWPRPVFCHEEAHADKLGRDDRSFRPQEHAAPGVCLSHVVEIEKIGLWAAGARCKQINEIALETSPEKRDRVGDTIQTGKRRR